MTDLAGNWRLFVALELPEEVRADLAERIDRPRARIPRDIRWTPPENLHLTLKFLGSCPPDRVEAIVAALAEAVPSGLPIDLATGSPGVFPGWASPRVVWVGLGGQIARLERLQRAVEEALIPIGFPAEGRDFRPHLTLGRVRETVSPDARRRIGDLLRHQACESGEPRPFTATTVRLMRSHLSPQGSRYESLFEWSSTLLAPP